MSDNPLKHYLSSLSEKDKEEMRNKAKESREAKKKAGEHLKDDFLDKSYWKELASEAGIRLPMSYIPASETKYAKKALKKLGIDQKEWLEAEGFVNMKQFAQNNPDWPAYAVVGLILEYWKEKQ